MITVLFLFLCGSKCLKMLALLLIISFLAISDGSRISDGSNISDGSIISDNHQGSDSVLAEVLSRLEHLEAENNELKRRLTETEDGFQAQIDELSARVNLCESKQEESPKLLNANIIEESMTDETKRTRRPKRKSRGKRHVSGKGVAFTAYLDHVETSLGQEQTIIYNQALLNDGNAYSTNTGIFRAPVPGVYLFSWSVMARRRDGQSGYDVRVDLLHNGIQVLRAVAESFVEHEDNQGSNTAVLRLAQGDEVWTHHLSGGSQTHGGTAERETSFTGVLLYEEEGVETIIG